MARTVTPARKTAVTIAAWTIGLAILVVLFRSRDSINEAELDELKG